jgi:hypothetical protein
MNRTEHLEWAKHRALEYLDAGDLNNAFASMTADLRKHPELENHCGIELGVLLMFGGFLSTDREMRKWIEGFN